MNSLTCTLLSTIHLMKRCSGRGVIWKIFYGDFGQSKKTFLNWFTFRKFIFDIGRLWIMICRFQPKLCFETKSTKLEVGHFTSISGHFLANYIDSFHKTEVLTVILMGQTCQNLIWIKSYNINHKVFYFLLFSIL